VIGWAADIFFEYWMLKARGKQGGGEPGKAGRRDDGDVDRGGCGFEGGELCPKQAELRIFTCHDSSATADYHL
jgi:hypothetical protein